VVTTVRAFACLPLRRTSEPTPWTARRTLSKARLVSALTMPTCPDALGQAATVTEL